MCAQDEERTIWANTERDTEDSGKERAWGSQSQKQLHISAWWQSEDSWKRQTRRSYFTASPPPPPPHTAEWVESPVWPPRVSASCNLIHELQNTAQRERERGPRHITTQAIYEWRWFGAFITRQMSANEKKNIWKNTCNECKRKVNPFCSL